MDNEKKKNEELQSRREFFKRVGKGVLPILGAAVLSVVPTQETQAYDCYGSCVFECRGCSGTCSGNCSGDCLGSCKGYVG